MSNPLPAECRIITFPVRGDQRGSLIAIEGGNDVPFDVARVYYVYATTPGTVRGHHAHRNLRQLAVAVSGSCVMDLDDGENRASVLLDDPGKGLLISGRVWREMREFSAGCVLMVLADAAYDEADYIRDYDAFIAEVRS